IIALGALAGIVLAVLFFLGKLGGASHVTYQDVQIKIAADKSSNANTSDEGASSRAPRVNNELPANVQKYIGDGDNRKVLDGWLAQIGDDQSRSDFLDNLSDIIGEAEQRHQDVTAAINAYKDIKLSRMTGVDQYVAEGEKAAAVAAALFFLL